MNEIVKLKSYGRKSAIESDSDEYHEIDQNAIIEETTFTIARPKQYNINEYEYFTQHNVKVKEKRKKKPKIEKSKECGTIMDIINSELASTMPPVIKNIVEILKFDEEHKFVSYQSSSLRNLLKNHHNDAEHGWSFNARPVKLSPIFPKVLENTVAVDFSASVHYVKPLMFKDFVSNFKDPDDNIQNQKFLDIQIQNMKFTHHHKFSLEVLLHVKLMEYYNEYLNNQKLLKEICRNIKVSRETKNNLKEQLLKITNDANENVKFDKTLLKYTAKLFYFKDLHIDTLKKQKDVIHKLLSLWADIQIVREKSGRMEVNYYLDVKKTTINDYEKEWNLVFETEYIDMLDKIEYEYAKAYIEYKETKNRLSMNGDEKKKISKPKLQIDEAKLKTETESIVNKIFPKDKIDLVLKSNKHTKKDLLKPVHVLFAYDYYFKVFVDDIFVCESELFTCKDYLHTLEVAESFSVQILPRNKTLKIALYENDIKVSSIIMCIDEIKHNFNLAEFKNLNFVYREYIVYPNHKYVGSGYGIKEIATESKVRLKSSNIFKSNLVTACEVNIKIGWNEKFDEYSHANILSSIEIERKIKRLLHGIDKPNINTLVDIINKLYERNVENNEKIIRALQEVCKITINNDHMFPFDDENGNIRLKLLYLRNNGGFVNIENKLVPLVTSQISTEQVNCLQNANDKVIDIQNLDTDIDTDPIDMQRHIGMKYVQKLNENLQQTLNEFLLQKTHKDVVKDFKDLSLRGLLTNQAKIMTLSASSSIIKQQLLKECSIKEQEIQVTVLRAFNLPDRSTSILTENDDDENERIAGFKLRPLRPFVKLSYHGNSAQTAPGIGCYPSWNQTIKIRTKFTPFSSIHINVYDEYRKNMTGMGTQEDIGTVHYRRCSRWLGTLLVPLSTVLDLGTLRGTFKLTTPPFIIGYENPTSKEAKTLIPEVRRLMKKDISFITLHITTSLSQLGGVQAYSLPVPNTPTDDHVIKHLNNFVIKYLNDFPSRSISLTFVDSSGKNRCVTDLLQPIPHPDLVCFPKNPKSRLGSAQSKSSGLSRSSSSKSSVKRKDEINSFVDEEERGSMYSGYSANWKNEENQLKAVNTCLRYVSLIPTYEVIESQVVTLTPQELLKVLYGSRTDHTILLASYFLHLGIKCWIVTGLALPYGLSTYALVKYDLVTNRYVTVDDQIYKSRKFLKKSEDFLWHVFDAVAGERYELRDVACPLKSVYYVFNEENIWVNIQSSQDCESLSFDFSKTSDWQPVFNTVLPVPRPPTLSTESLYSAPCEVERLQESLETKITSKVEKWRSRMKTVWNRYCCTLLRETLPQWEYWAFNSTDFRPEPGHRLKQLMASYKMYGFPLNMHYVNAKSVLANVKASTVHANDDPDVEFALAVQVFPYPNNVISVWVFLASITRI
ncbi:unnamed protein product [Parnassius mnemosyne]|uniref:C2 domain-containing protein n=1 Tax=Parnassius mnemosyne TaxID=213953 RepID=A0AAV1KS46_9NEOP